MLDLARVAADDVAPVLRSERPRELELDEPEQASYLRRPTGGSTYSPT
jgi:hypothetical protein